MALCCAATKRPFKHHLDWKPFFEIAATDAPYRDKLTQYAALAADHFDTARFEEWCGKELAHLDEVAWEYFGTDRAKDAVRKKVHALFPEHEWDEFVEHFWSCIQEWREREGEA